METTKVAGSFAALSDLNPGDFFRFTSNGVEYQVAGIAPANRIVARAMYVCRRIELDGKSGNLFVVEDDRPVILTRVSAV